MASDPSWNDAQEPQRVDLERRGFRDALEPIRGHVVAPGHVVPAVRVLHGESQRGGHDLSEHGAQVRAGILGVVDLGAQAGLADREAVGDRRRRHPDVDAEAAHLRVPVIALRVRGDEVRGHPEVAADGLPDPQAVERARQWVRDGVRDRPVPLVARVQGRDEVVPALEDGAGEQLDPFGTDRPEVRVHDDERLDAELAGDEEERPQCGALAGDAVHRGVRQAHARESVARADEQDPLDVVGGLGLHDDALRAVGRPAVGVHDDGAQVREVLDEARLRGTDDVTDRRLVPEAGDPHHDVGLTDPGDLVADGGREGGQGHGRTLPPDGAAAHARSRRDPCASDGGGPSGRCAHRRCLPRCARRSPSGGHTMPAPKIGPIRVAAITAAVVLIAGLAPGVVSGTGASGPQPGDAVVSDQIVVRWADGSVGTAFGATSDAPSVGARPERVTAVTRSTGHPSTWLRTLAVGGDVYKLDSMLAPGAMASTVASVRAVPGVVAAYPDAIAHADAAPPNDTYWPQQWDLSGGTTSTTYGIDLLGAWDRTQGSGVVVAVLDTGITVHPDLAGQTVAGYDFISSATVANDGDGRDPDPSDPGDNTNAVSGHSSWHGTHVTGTIVASTNNGAGIAGIAYRARVQPVRVLGVGGGYFSDISDGIVWASGGAVSGVPANATPARVENLSFGGSTPCPASLQSAVNAAISRRTVIVAAAGNSAADASGFAPADCAGVVAVAATTSSGARASFSNYGATVSISAPGVSLWSTLNTGVTGPASPTYAQYSGTSMATPHVAGAFALMLAANPSLTPAQALSLMRQTAHPLAAGGCPQGCGAGIVDAAAAVAAAVNGAPSPTPSPTPTGGPTPTPTGTPGPTPTAKPTPTPTPGCASAAPVVTASPTSSLLPRGTSVFVTLTVRNADAATCGSSTFALSVTMAPALGGVSTTWTGPVSMILQRVRVAGADAAGAVQQARAPVEASRAGICGAAPFLRLGRAGEVDRLADFPGQRFGRLGDFHLRRRVAGVDRAPPCSSRPVWSLTRTLDLGVFADFGIRPPESRRLWSRRSRSRRGPIRS